MTIKLYNVTLDRTGENILTPYCHRTYLDGLTGERARTLTVPDLALSDTMVLSLPTVNSQGVAYTIEPNYMEANSRFYWITPTVNTPTNGQTKQYLCEIDKPHTYLMGETDIVFTEDSVMTRCHCAVDADVETSTAYFPTADGIVYHPEPLTPSGDNDENEKYSLIICGEVIFDHDTVPADYVMTGANLVFMVNWKYGNSQSATSGVTHTYSECVTLAGKIAESGVLYDPTGTNTYDIMIVTDMYIIKNAYTLSNEKTSISSKLYWDRGTSVVTREVCVKGQYLNPTTYKRKINLPRATRSGHSDDKLRIGNRAVKIDRFTNIYDRDVDFVRVSHTPKHGTFEPLFFSVEYAGDTYDFTDFIRYPYRSKYYKDQDNVTSKTIAAVLSLVGVAVSGVAAVSSGGATLPVLATVAGAASSATNIGGAIAAYNKKNVQTYDSKGSLIDSSFEIEEQTSGSSTVSVTHRDNIFVYHQESSPGNDFDFYQYGYTMNMPNPGDISHLFDYDGYTPATTTWYNFTFICGKLKPDITKMLANYNGATGDAKERYRRVYNAMCSHYNDFVDTYARGVRIYTTYNDEYTKERELV